jgi:hypothetical protein
MAKRFFTVITLALLSTVFAAGAFAQVTISGGLALSSIKGIEVDGMSENGIDPKIGFGGNIYADYLLPLSIPLSLGFEIGVDSAKFTMKEAISNSNTGGYKDAEERATVIPLLVRAAYHFDLMANLDLFVVGKIGYAVGFWDGEFKKELESYKVTIGNFGGFAFGFDVGAAYYFTPLLGVFAEAGFDDYMLKGKISDQGYNATLEIPFNRFLTIGVSTKF